MRSWKIYCWHEFKSFVLLSEAHTDVAEPIISCQQNQVHDHMDHPVHNLPRSNLSVGMPPGKTNSSVVPTLYPFPDSLFPSPPSPARLEFVPNPVREEVMDSRPLGCAPPSSSDRLMLFNDDFDLTMTVVAGEVGLVRGITRWNFVRLVW